MAWLPGFARPAYAARLSFVALVGYSAALLALSVMNPVGFVVTYAKFFLKIHHIAAFAVYVILGAWWLSCRGSGRGQRIIIACLMAFAFGVFIEAVQGPLSHRSGQAKDLIQNAIGIGIGATLVWVWGWWADHRVRRCGLGSPSVE